MSQQDYHNAVVEAAKEAIEQGRMILATRGNVKIELSARPTHIEKPRSLGDILREAAERDINKKCGHKD